MDHKCQKCLWYEFFPNNWLHFFFQGLNLKLSPCFGTFRPKLLIMFHAVESWWIRKSKKCFYFWHAWIFKLRFLLCSTCFVFPWRSHSVTFFTWSGLFVCSYHGIFFSSSELGSWWAISSKSAFSSNLSKQRLWILPSRSELTSLYF